jgi:hypothetical protein
LHVPWQAYYDEDGEGFFGGGDEGKSRAKNGKAGLILVAKSFLRFWGLDLLAQVGSKQKRI